MLKKNIDNTPEKNIKILEKKQDDYKNACEELPILLEIAKSYGNISDFINDFSLDDSVNVNQEDCLTISTIHSSKGLEFANVYIPCFTDNSYPGAVKNEKQLEENRRLLYVAITRAKEKLWLYQSDYKTSESSPYLDEIEGLYLEIQDESETSTDFQAPIIDLNLPVSTDIELVPEPLWNKNIRTKYPAMWPQISKNIIHKAKNKCQVCGKKTSNLHCHEVWEYDDKKHIQKLVNLAAICEQCHSYKHLGHTQLKGEDAYNDAVYKYAEVNNKDISIAYLDVEIALSKWRERNNYEWEQIIDTKLVSQLSGIDFSQSNHNDIATGKQISYLRYLLSQNDLCLVTENIPKTIATAMISSIKSNGFIPDNYCAYTTTLY